MNVMPVTISPESSVLGRGTELECEVVRQLLPTDLQALLERASAPLDSKSSLLGKVRHAHHRLAMLVVQGLDTVEISFITGYSTNYINGLRRDPTFSELLDYYAIERDKVFVDTLERMKQIGVTVLDELQSRLAEGPEKWSNREMMEMAEMMLLRPIASHQTGQSPAGSGVVVNVKFVQSSTSGSVPVEANDEAGLIIDHRAADQEIPL